jgi:methyl-accepting chemotaxis protein
LLRALAIACALCAVAGGATAALGALPVSVGLGTSTAAALVAAAIACARPVRPPAPAMAEAAAAPGETALPPPIEPETDETPLAALTFLRDGAIDRRVAGGPNAAAANAALAAAQAALDEAVALADLMAMGDLSVAASRAHKGAFDGLVRAFDQSAEAFRKIVAGQQQAAADVGAQAAALAHDADSLTDSAAAQMVALDEARRAAARAAESVEAVRGAAEDGASAARNAAAVAAKGAAGAEAINASIARVEQSSKSIREVLALTAAIAQQTKLLGVNASVEAARAGEAGRGFAVVAAEIQALAGRAGEAAKQIEAQIAVSDAALSDCAAQARAGADSLRGIAGEVRAVDAASAAIAAAVAAQKQALAEAMGSIAEAEKVGRTVEAFARRTGEIGAALDGAAAGLQARIDRLIVEDAEMIEAVIARAAQISDAFEAGVRDGRISMADLFSADYRPIPGTNPPQFMPPFVRFTDAVVTPIIEEALTINERVIFSAAVNRDGFLPTHNRKFSAPQGPDPAKNAANSRNRRFFNDRVGLGAGRSTAPALVQAYRRDMGGGRFVTMKDVSAPIIVQGRHWGGLRIGYLPRSERRKDAERQPAYAA